VIEKRREYRESSKKEGRKYLVFPFNKKGFLPFFSVQQKGFFPFNKKGFSRSTKMRFFPFNKTRFFALFFRSTKNGVFAPFFRSTKIGFLGYNKTRFFAEFAVL
jgi:hypothetical protein